MMIGVPITIWVLARVVKPARGVVQRGDLGVGAHDVRPQV
ncbi:MAG: hypothetical protein JWO67_1239 [Streptosporangiaceae bacterium]|nr:hypothetical protein [Streptosporangiaceae bacterium]